MSLRRFTRIASQFARELIARISAQNGSLAKAAIRQPLRLIQTSSLAKTPRIKFSQNIQHSLRGTFRGNRAVRPFLEIARLHQNRRAEYSHGLRMRGFMRLRENRGVFERARHVFGRNPRYNKALNYDSMPQALNGYEIGNYIAHGCNAAVYELRRIDPTAFYNEPSAPLLRKDFPLALKMMFNYDYSRSEKELWMIMGQELIPLRDMPKSALQGYMGNFKPLLKGHPNVVNMHTAFVDILPLAQLTGAESYFPEAIPDYEDYQGSRPDPKTLFLVMHRYRMTLYDYRRDKHRFTDPKSTHLKGRVMLAQLLEAIVFLYNNKISHRDIKSDNILLEFDHEDEVPHLVLSDFGSALSTGSWKVKYPNEHIDLGGNIATRAPEITRQIPAPNVVLDFSMADTWSCATIAYEIFTRHNPFYIELKSQTYEEQQLKRLPQWVHYSVKNVIYQMLRVDPDERPKAHVAANVMSISLFRPYKFCPDVRSILQRCGLAKEFGFNGLKTWGQTLKYFEKKVQERITRKLDEIIKLYAGETIVARLNGRSDISRAELQLRATFLSRINRDDVWAALSYFVDDETPQLLSPLSSQNVSRATTAPFE
ncbi:protein kinase domain-containing protein [Ditylenchus destructor]|uniref:non-specific serine/threonine protein kinase n=1 Tax=Ditylenchus destructor TaxID=166010 RepID=A0AAD4NCJ2_9BILA|nr:protein kinase domain-containing protein [Ditylenchus destructor]